MNYSLRSFSILLLTFIFSSAVYSQTNESKGFIVGQITEKLSGHPVTKAKISVTNISKSLCVSSAGFCESRCACRKAFQFQTLFFRAVSRLFQHYESRQRRSAELRILPADTAISE